MKLQPFAQHEQALTLRARRYELLSSNIANADTPNYKARDIDFRSALQNARTGSVALHTTSELHQTSRGHDGRTGELLYRVPTQPSMDGNTVEADVEQAEFADNAVHYRATLEFLNGTIRTLRYALKGSD